MLLGLPSRIRTHRPHQANALGALAFQQHAHIHIARIHQVLPWRHAFVHECLLDGWQPLDIGDWRIGRLHVRNHLDLLFVTGLGQMHFIADPTHVTFRAVAHLRIIRGIMALGVGR